MTTRSIPREKTIDEITLALSEFGMTRDEFIAEGQAGTLKHPELRDYWLVHGDRLTDVGVVSQGDTLRRSTGSGPRRHRDMTVHYVSREELRDRVEQDISRVGMTLEEFIAEGEADSLTDGNLRDLWLIYGDSIAKE